MATYGNSIGQIGGEKAGLGRERQAEKGKTVKKGRNRAGRAGRGWADKASQAGEQAIEAEADTQTRL